MGCGMRWIREYVDVKDNRLLIQGKMPGPIRSIIDSLSLYFLWVILAVLVTLTLFQVHGTLISIALAAIENPSTRPPGWTTGSVYGFSRLLWLILGIFWLGWVMYTLEYLREGQQYQILKQRVIRLLLILGGIYIVCIILLFF